MNEELMNFNGVCSSSNEDINGRVCNVHIFRSSFEIRIANKKPILFNDINHIEFKYKRKETGNFFKVIISHLLVIYLDNNQLFELKINNEGKVKSLIEQLSMVKKEIDITDNDLTTYREKIDELFIKLKKNGELVNVIQNIFPEIPITIFLHRELYVIFELLIMGNNKIGEKILWSSIDERSEIERELNKGEYNPEIVEEIKSFIIDKLTMLKRYFKEIITLDCDYDYDFLILRLFQMSSASYYSSLFDVLYKASVVFNDIKEMTILDCLQAYFDIKNIKEKDEEPGVSFLTHYLIHHGKLGEMKSIDEFNYLVNRRKVLELIQNEKENIQYMKFEKRITKKHIPIPEGYSITDTDLMSGIEFEEFIAKLFVKLGYNTEVTKHSGDNGIDIIAEKEGKKFGIQTKCYTNPVSISAIQEVVAGLKYYGCDSGIVITNSKFTAAAIKLAHVNGIKLWDRKVLEEKISEIYSLECNLNVDKS